MSCCTPTINNLNIRLEDIKAGDTWGGLYVVMRTTGVGLDDPIESLEMVWTNTGGTVGLTLTSASGITIMDADAWEFRVDQITPFPLAAGVWSWAIASVNSEGIRLTRLAGTKKVKA